jgi:hypothetical protein
MKMSAYSGAVAYACNPSYLGSRDGEDQGSRPAVGKMFTRPPSQPMAGCGGTYLSSQLCGEVQIGESLSRPPGHKVRPYLKNN